MSWHEREDGMIDFRARLPKDEAALLLAALNAAKDQFGPPPPKPDPCGEQPEPVSGVGVYSNADALLDVARGFLQMASEDRSGEDRTLVVVQVSAENLARNVPAETPPAEGEPSDDSTNVPAETPPGAAVCHIDGVGSIEPTTAQRLACDNPLLSAVVDKHGEVLALGRTPPFGEQGAAQGLDDPGQDVLLSGVSSDPASESSSCDPVDPGRCN
jgi:hypothetical protein